MSVLFRYSMAFMLAFCMALSPVSAAAEDVKEGVVKVSYINNFSLDTTWPESVIETGLTDDKQKIIYISVCVLGDSIVGKMGAVFEKASHPTWKYKLKNISSVEHIEKKCNVLYISKSEAAKLDTILQAIKSRPVLTVSDIPEFAAKGGMIELSLTRNTLKVGTINNRVAMRSGVQISAGLLDAALKVIGE